MILLADDELLVIEKLGKLLGRKFGSVICAKNGNEALLEFINNKESIKLVVTDLIMPVLNGLEFTRIIKKIDPSLPVVIISGTYESHSDIKEAKEISDLYLTKPINPKYLIESIEKLLKKREDGYRYIT